MITLQELCDYLEQLFDVSQFLDYCPNGLQVEGKTEIKKVATAVTASLKAIEEAVAMDADLLLVHHGLFWKGGSQIVTGPMRKKLALLLKNKLSLLGYHLPMDAHREFGNNWKAAREMQWKDLQPFFSINGMAIGVQGKVDLPRIEFQKRLEKYYNHNAQVALGGKEHIFSAGLVSGGAYKQIQDAAVAGLDAFVTGNTDEPAWYLAHEEGVNFYSLGHSATEKIGPKAIGEHLREKFGVDVVFIDCDNPF
ncbi:MAG: Nif3-like dinuclear metal center hexameric protein [Waddliaceae bacterium]